MATIKQIQIVARAGHSPGTTGLRVQRDGHSEKFNILVMYSESNRDTTYTLIQAYSHFPKCCNQIHKSC